MSVECQVNVKSQSELDIGGRETCLGIRESGTNRLVRLSFIHSTSHSMLLLISHDAIF